MCIDPLQFIYVIEVTSLLNNIDHVYNCLCKNHPIRGYKYIASHEISFTGCNDAIMWPSFCVYFAPADIEFDSESGGYYPILYLNDYWNLAQDYMPINDTTKSVS